MRWDRRKFLRAVATGSIVLPLTSRGWASKALLSLPSSEHEADNSLLEELQRAAFEYFWNEADAHTGLVRDRANADGIDARVTASIAATGFGLTALCIGHERNYRPPL